MKKYLLLFLLYLLIPCLVFASSLEEKQYRLELDGAQFDLAFKKNTVVMTGDEGFEAVFWYAYDDPLGNIEGILPFYTQNEFLIFATQTLWAWDVTPEPPQPPPPDPDDDPIDLNKVVWLHTNVSKWAVTAKLNAIKIKTETVVVDYDKACVWPGESTDGGEPVNANPWVFVDLDGTWYAATWEWLKVCQTEKFLYTIDGSHIKVPPLNTWHPVSGETYYFMVSGLARDSTRNVLERSNLLKVVWP
jgi:hypothetical protein